jgi:hypothetical protein
MPDSEAGAEEANRDKTLSEMMDLPLDWLRSKYNVPKPMEGEETTGTASGGRRSETGDRILDRQIAYATWKEERKAAGLSVATPPDSLKQAASDAGDLDEDGLEAKYDPAQPRDPAGTRTGGRWTAVDNTPEPLVYDGTKPKNTFTKGGKNDTISHAENGEKRTTQAGRIKDRTGSRDGEKIAGIAGEAAEDVLRGVAGADAGRHPSELNWVELGLVGRPGRIQAEQAALAKLAAERPELVIGQNAALRSAEGGEHVIEMSADGTRVVKHAKEYGFTLFLDTPDMHDLNNRAIAFRKSAPSEYLGCPPGF